MIPIKNVGMCYFHKDIYSCAWIWTNIEVYEKVVIYAITFHLWLFMVNFYKLIWIYYDESIAFLIESISSTLNGYLNPSLM
jgi:hypothetical protein